MPRYINYLGPQGYYLESDCSFERERCIFQGNSIKICKFNVILE